ncbi:squamosa promoter-binding-like protein 7 isoform X2 [Camellia sinensis]|nr:squamosa promoter-binding-like protein 7 isoform X2 [Camellia sinensis]
MPVELEGYIRPGCTILTMFISMPNFMWSKLHEDPVMYIPDLVGAPGKMLYGRGSLLVYLNNVIFRVMRDGTSVMQVKVEEQAPKLCYVYPTCFEAGKPMEFMACGINLLQPKFWFLVSFAGKCLAYDYCVPPLYGDTEGVTASFNHQLLRIYIPHTEPDFFFLGLRLLRLRMSPAYPTSFPF